jgi:iron complex outermembrane recepter protein
MCNSRILLSVLGWLLIGLILVGGLPAATSATPPAPTETQAVALDPVIVTAEKSAADIQEVPVSITALSEAHIEDSGITTIEDVALQVPNMFISNWGTRGNSFVFIRGIGAVNNDPAVGFYVDDVNYLDYRVFDTNLVDIERIEVLRGPQGTLYGRNSLAGVINIVTKKPDDTVKAGVEQTIAEYDDYRTSLYASGPIVSEKLFLGLSGNWEQRDGYKHNDYLGQDVDDRDDWIGRLHLRWTPNEMWDVTASLDGERLRDGAYPLTSLDNSRNQPDRVAYDDAGYNDRDALGGSLRVACDTTMLSMTSLTAFRHYDDKAFNDQDFSIYPMATAFEEMDDDQFTQELRFASPDGGRRTRWIAGLYGFEADQEHYLMMDYAPDVVGIGYPQVTVHTTSSVETYGLAVFGQITRTMNDNLDVTGGLRYDYEKSRLDFTSIMDMAGLGSSASTLDDNIDGDAWLPKLQLDYRWRPTLMTYASVSRGYRSAGFNMAFDNPANQTFDAEFSWNYELGLKSSWFDKRLTANAAAFYIDLKDQQVVQLISTGDTYISNAGESRSMGMEAEIVALLAEGVRLEAGFGFTDAEYDTYADPVSGEDYAGNRTPLAPEYTGNVALQYRRPLGQPFSWFGWTDALVLFARAEIQAIGPFYWNDRNTLKQDAYELVNLRVGLETEHVDVVLWAKNLFDTSYDAVAFEFTENNPLGQAGDPRVVGLTIRARF